jgi:hypothetical protein
VAAVSWPQATLDPIRRLRVLASALPGVGMVERTIDAPFDRVWGFVADLEHSVPAFDVLVSSLQITRRDGDHLVVRAKSPLARRPTRFEAELTDGWCWMQSAVYLVGMAAVPDGDRTRFANLEGVPFSSSATRLLRPLFRRVVAGDVRGIARCLGADVWR